MVAGDAVFSAVSGNVTEAMFALSKERNDRVDGLDSGREESASFAVNRSQELDPTILGTRRNRKREYKLRGKSAAND
jgi:hypothetical protein